MVLGAITPLLSYGWYFPESTRLNAVLPHNQRGSSNTTHIACSRDGKGQEMNGRDMGKGRRIWGWKIQWRSCGGDARREMGADISGA